MIDDYLRGETFYSRIFFRYTTTIPGKMKNYYNKNVLFCVGAYYSNIFVHIIVVILSDNLRTVIYDMVAIEMIYISKLFPIKTLQFVIRNISLIG